MHNKCTKSQQLWFFAFQHKLNAALMYNTSHILEGPCCMLQFVFCQARQRNCWEPCFNDGFFSMHTYIMCSISAGRRYAKCTFCRKQALQGRRSLQVSLFARLAMKSYLPIRPRKRKCLFESYGQGKPRPNARRYFWG